MMNVPKTHTPTIWLSPKGHLGNAGRRGEAPGRDVAALGCAAGVPLD